MRILLVTPYYAPEYQFGGPARKISGLAGKLAERGHETQVVTFHSERPNDSSRQTIEDIPVQYLSWRGSGLWQVPTSAGLLRAAVENADVVHCFGLYTLICPMAARAARGAGRPFVIEPMGMFVPRVRNYRLKQIYNRLITKRLFEQASAVIATAQVEADEIKASGLAAKVIVRRNGIELRPRASNDARNRLRTAWGIAPDELLVGYIGRISPNKGLLPLLSAFEAADVPRMRLLIAGPVSRGDYMQELERAAAASPRSERIALRGAMYGDEHDAALSSLDLFVLPSEHAENFGNAAAEAAAAGVPVLVTRECGIAPIIDGRFGLAVEQGVESLRRGLETMLAPAARGRWSARAETIRAELSWEQPVQQMEEIYRGAIHHAR